MQVLVAILVLVFPGAYVVPNIIRYPWHSLVFVVVVLRRIFHWLDKR